MAYMNRIGIAFDKYIGRMFQNASDSRVVSSIDVRNMRNVFVLSAITGVFDTVTLILFSAMNWSRPNFLRVFLSVCWCVTACVVVAFLSRELIKKYERDGTISNVNTNLLVMVFYVVLSVWSILVDVSHYSEGEQMLTYYIVQFCFVCFVAMRPRVGGVLIASSFLTMYLCLYFVDGAEQIQPQNFLLFGLIAVFGNAIQYTMLCESEKHKLRILELNQFLQREASIDDLTKLKNRNALRSDFDKFMGKNIYAVMADVDDFKSYNDAYGHLVGDNVLWQVASATKTAFAEGDAYRYGGDEFLIILTDLTEEQFKAAVAVWQEALRTIETPNTTQSITCSFGYARCLLKGPDDLRSAIKAADDMLYQVKKSNDSPCRDLPEAQ